MKAYEKAMKDIHEWQDLGMRPVFSYLWFPVYFIAYLLVSIGFKD